MERVLDQFSRLSTAIIDACSLIYCMKARFLTILSQEISLYTVAEVIDEVGHADLPVQVLTPRDKLQTTDKALLSCASDKKMAIITEDKKIITSAQQQKLPYYNSLMMLLFLVYKSKLSGVQYTFYYDRLRSVAHYSNYVYEYAEQVFDAIVAKRTT